MVEESVGGGEEEEDEEGEGVVRSGEGDGERRYGCADIAVNGYFTCPKRRAV